MVDAYCTYDIHTIHYIYLVKAKGARKYKGCLYLRVSSRPTNPNRPNHPLNHQPCQKYHIPMMSYPKNDQQSINPHDPSQPRHLRRRAAPPPPGPSKRPRGLGRVGAPPGDLHDLETRYGEWTQPWDFNGIFLISWDISTITMVI